MYKDEKIILYLRAWGVFFKNSGLSNEILMIIFLKGIKAEMLKLSSSCVLSLTGILSDLN